MADAPHARDEGRGARRKAVATIYDVARLSGVSASTVSRALNKPGRISPATEQRIREVASAVGYQLNPMARALPTGRTQTIALLVSDITNPVYFEVIRGAERVASQHGYVLILAESQESAEVELAAAQRMLTSVDGVILVSTRLSGESIEALRERKPILLVNRVVRGVPSVVPDVEPGIAAAAAHLDVLGHRRIGYLAGPPSSWMSRLRLRVLRREAEKKGLTVTAVGSAPPTVQGGASHLEAAIRSESSVVVAFNDLMAIGLLRAAQAAGVRVPEDLSIMGFDDIFGSDFTSPPLTTIRSPLPALGEEAARRLITELSTNGNDHRLELPTELVVRGSTGPAANGVPR